MSSDKTIWGTTLITFLGFLIDSAHQTISIPADKVARALVSVQSILAKKKVTVKAIQKLCGFLNFLCRAVVPGRAFTRRLYALYSPSMKPFHHVRIHQEFRDDLKMWEQFLVSPSIFCRPFLDFSEVLLATQLDWSTDASGVIGFGGIFNGSWFKGLWSQEFLSLEPSIEYQELFAVVASVLTWGDLVRNRRICIFCDNQALVQMVNNSTLSCKNCMVLIRILTLKSLVTNLRVFARYISSKDNKYSDALLRDRMDLFWNHAKNDNKHFDSLPQDLPDEIWPVEKIWKN